MGTVIRVPSPIAQEVRAERRKIAQSRRMFFKNLIDDIDSMMARDPAARSRMDIVFSYPGFHAMMIYRMTHRLWR